MKKGFTLIELLAVIVILAVIALIATPIVLSIIEETKESAVLRSAEHYLSAVENSIMKKNLTAGGSFSPNICVVQESGNLLCDGTEKLELEISGEVPSSGTITFDNGKVTSVELTQANKTIIKNEKGELVYKDSSNVIKLCAANTTKATALVYQYNNPPEFEGAYERKEVGLLAGVDGAYTPGVAYTCNFIDDNVDNNMIFYVLSSTENDVILISSFNIGTSSWNIDPNDDNLYEDEDKQALGAKLVISNVISTWKKLSNEQKATVKLPTAQQIAEVVGQDFNSNYISHLPNWLTSYSMSPVAYGYWTSTNKNGVWFVNVNGDVLSYDLPNTNYGIRPVITVSKSNL